MQQTLQTFLDREPGLVRRIEVVEGPTGRRNWSDDLKAKIVAETLAPGAKVAAVAARHRVSPQQVTTWRRLARTGQLIVATGGQGFAPVLVEAEQTKRDMAAATWIEVESGGVIVRLPADASPTLIGEIAARLRTPKFCSHSG